jgi:hypothetical protein
MFEQFVIPDVPAELWKLFKAKIGLHVANLSGPRGRGVMFGAGPFIVEIAHDRMMQEVGVRVMYGR